MKRTVDLPVYRSRRAVLLLGAISLTAGISVGVLAQQASNAPAVRLIRFHSPSLGSPDAKVNLVEFLDPACEGCKAFYPVVKEILEQNKGRVRLWVRYVPFHRGADYVVRALEAARMQGRYWEGLDAIFANQREWTRGHVAVPELVLKVLEGANLDMARLRKDMTSPDIDRIMKQDMDDAKALKVMQTPTFFVNGRSLDDYGFDQLRALVRSEVQAQYP